MNPTPDTSDLRKWIDVFLTECDFLATSNSHMYEIDEAEEKLISLINHKLAEAIKRELQSIVDKNHAKELGTYDYDGIAESVFEELTKRKEDK